MNNNNHVCIEMRRLYLAIPVLIVSTLLSVGTVSVHGQSRYIDRAGTATFFSSAPLEDIAADNHQVISILDIANGEVVASMLMRSFNFRKALMQEHFNESFVESHKYPKATFKGKVANIGELNVSRDGTYSLRLSGDITIHGVTRPIALEAQALVKDGTIEAKAVFPLRVADFKIEVPKLVIDNIAEIVEVTVSFHYRPM